MRRNNTENDTMLLVHNYEAMLRNDELGFLAPSAFEQLVDYYEQKQDLSKALLVVEHALSQYAYSSTFYIRNAHLLIEIGKLDEAILFLDKAELYDSSDIEIYLLRSEIFAEKGDFSTAEEVLNHAKTLVSGDELSEVYLAFASIHERKERYDKVFYSLRDALLVNPKCKEALERIWLAFEVTQLYKESIQLHLKVVDEEPYSHLAWYNLAHAYYSTQEYENAIDSYEFVMAIDEKFEYAYLDCGECYFLMGMYEKAIDCYEDALDNDIKPTDTIYSLMGACFEKLGDYDRAKELYLTALELNPENDKLYFFLGGLYALLDEWKKAENLYKKAIEMRSGEGDYHLGLGLVYAQLEKQKEANEHLSAACDLAPDDCEKWVQYAIFLIHVDLPESALAVIEEATMYCENKGLNYCKVAALLTLGNRKEGLALLHHALEVDYANHTLLFASNPDLTQDAEIVLLLDAIKAREEQGERKEDRGTRGEASA